MDHIVYVDRQAKELMKLLAGDQTMIVRGASGRKLPCSHIQANDRLFFVQDNGAGMVTARCVVNDVLNSDDLTQAQSTALLAANQSKLKLKPQQINHWSGKRFFVLIELKEIRLIEPFEIDQITYSNMDEWIPVGEIERAKLGC